MGIKIIFSSKNDPDGPDQTLKSRTHSKTILILRGPYPTH